MPDNNSFTLDDIVSDNGSLEDGGDLSGGNGSNEPDPVMDDIDALFGGPGGDGSSSGRKKTDKPDNTPSDLDDGIFGTPKNPQVSLKNLQSERDKLRTEIEKINKDLQQYKSIADFTVSLQDDVEARRAFIATLEPDLVKPKDPLTFVKEELKKEFGEEFSPTAENVDPIQAQLYNARMQELYAEWKNKDKGLPKDLSELKARRTKAQQEAAKAAQAEKDKIVNDMKWDDAAWEEFTKWGQGFKLYHLAKLYSKAKGNERSSAPQLALGRGGRPLNPSKYKAYLDGMFGPN